MNDRLAAVRAGNDAPPIRVAVRHGDRVSLQIFSDGAGKYKHYHGWRFVIGDEGEKGVLVVVHSAMRWLPFRRVDPPRIAVLSGHDLRVPRSGYFYPSRALRALLAKAPSAAVPTKDSTTLVSITNSDGVA